MLISAVINNLEMYLSILWKAKKGRRCDENNTQFYWLCLHFTYFLNFSLSSFPQETATWGSQERRTKEMTLQWFITFYANVWIPNHPGAKRWVLRKIHVLPSMVGHEWKPQWHRPITGTPRAAAQLLKLCSKNFRTWWDTVCLYWQQLSNFNMKWSNPEEHLVCAHVTQSCVICLAAIHSASSKLHKMFYVV